MKIEITNEERGFKLYKENSQYPMENFRNSFLSKFLFFDDDIYNLLGEKKYKQFENGKCIFEVSKYDLELITGMRSARTREELLMYND
jgi:hypothetical protein